MTTIEVPVTTLDDIFSAANLRVRQRSRKLAVLGRIARYPRRYLSAYRISQIAGFLASRSERIRFIKMDLEGGEYHALRGGVSMIRAKRPFIVFENGREKSATLYGYKRADWFDLFASLGYCVFDLFGAPFRPEDWNTAGIPWNFLAVSAGSDDEYFTRERLPLLIRELAKFS
jgi:hypothetical protein